VTNMIESPKRPKLVGNFIRQRRETLNLSQRALGMLFDPPVTTQFISNVERGVTPLPPAHVPTLTRALQVSEAEMMSLLEREYTMKLSGRLGIQADPYQQAGAVIIPMNGQTQISVPAQIHVAPHDYDFIRAVYDAYKLADPKTRQTFSSICETVLNLSRMSQSTNVPAAASVTVVASTLGNQRTQN
jgi:transcriptional regulator with XRE-family HTH domain